MGTPEHCDAARVAAWLRPHGTEPDAPRAPADRFAQPLHGWPGATTSHRTPAAASGAAGPFATRPGRSVGMSFAVGAEAPAAAPPPPQSQPCDAEADLPALLARVVRQFRRSGGGEARAEFDIDGMRVVLEESFLGGLASDAAAARRPD